jgi:hypothetical protein
MATRSKLQDRRASVTLPVEVTMDGANTSLLMTVGFGADGKIREIFCASFKAGTGLNVLVMDACVLVSLLLQHGYTTRQIFDTMAQGPSLIGALVKAAVIFEEGLDAT